MPVIEIEILEAQRCTIHSEIIDYICLLNDEGLFKIYSEQGRDTLNIGTSRSDISTQYYKKCTRWGKQTAADI